MTGSDGLYFDRAGRPLTLQQYARLVEGDPSYKRVAADDIDLYRVSTVWRWVLNTTGHR